MPKPIKNIAFDDQFEAFMKESFSSEDSINSARIAKFLEPAKPREGKPWWLDDEELDDGKFDEGLSGKHFMKKKSEPKHSTPVYETEEGENEAKTESKIDPSKKKAAEKQKSRGKNLTGKVRGSRGWGESSMSKDSLEDISEKSDETEEHRANAGRRAVREGMDSGTNRQAAATGARTNSRIGSLRPGADTLDEIADKEKFFQAMEEDGVGTVDYGRLNRELSQTASGIGLTSENKRQATIPEQNRHNGEEGKNLPQPTMLSNVSLMDSMESTANTTTSPGKKGEKADEVDVLGHTAQDTLKTVGTGVMGTNTSYEMEALQKAYREVELSPTIKPEDRHPDIEISDGCFDEPDGAHLIAQEVEESPAKPDRTVDDILREVEELQRKAQEKDAHHVEIELLSDLRSPKTGIREQDSIIKDDELILKTGNKQKASVPDQQVKQSWTKQAKSFQLKGRTRSPDGSSPDGKGKKKGKSKTVKSSGYGQKSQLPVRKEKAGLVRSRDNVASLDSPVSGKPSSPRKTPPSRQPWSPADVAKRKIKGTESSKEVMRQSLEGQVMENQLMTSVESFVQYITEQFTNKDLHSDQLVQAVNALSTSFHTDKGPSLEREKGLLEERKQWQENWKEEKQGFFKQQADYENRERDLNRKMEAIKLEYDEQVFKLKQENFVLSAKAAEAEVRCDVKKKVSEGGCLEGVSKEQMLMLEKEIREQEQLMAGYQTENKRLYDELKTVQKYNKLTEERLFKDNQNLIREVATLRSQLERKEEELKNKGVITSLAAQQEIAAGNIGESCNGAGRAAYLEAELGQAKLQQTNQLREMKIMRQTKEELDQHIDRLVREREANQLRIDEARTLKSEEAKEIEKKYQVEIDRLSRKLKWYAENQQMLDEDAECLKAKNEEIFKLKARIEELQTEAGRKVEESKIRSRERAADAKRIMDLERQVKEMEQILRRRHPNSLPTLLMAVAAAESAAQPVNKPPSIQALENRLLKQEKELENKEKESNKMLRGMEQKFNAVKYEERIDDLEGQLSRYSLPGESRGAYKEGEHPHTHALALERELEGVRERYRKQVTDLQTELDRLTTELYKHQKKEEVFVKTDQRVWKDREKELENKIKVLTQEMDLKDRTITELRERAYETETGKQTDTGSGAMKSKSGDKDKKWSKLKSDQGSREKSIMTNGEKALSPYPDRLETDRQYQPQTFAGQHISEVLVENERLKVQIEHLQLELDQQRVDLRKSLAKAEGTIRKSREEYDEQIEVLRSSHQRELERVLTDQAVQHSVSRLAELQSKVDTQEVMLSHLRGQLAQAQVDGEQLSILRIRETALQTQISQLSQELREVRSNYTPEMRHFEALTDKISQMERRHEQREQELQQLVRHTHQTASRELDQETDKWKKIVEAKNQEVMKFRSELDSILEVLRELKRQGVVLSGTAVKS